jgi:hypothetical protein
MDEKEGLCEGTLVECSGGGEGASGVGALAVWVKYADGEVDELEREVRASAARARAVQDSLRALLRLTLRGCRLRFCRPFCGSSCC